jgi:hypothetical protein
MTKATPIVDTASRVRVSVPILRQGTFCDTSLIPRLLSLITCHTRRFGCGPPAPLTFVYGNRGAGKTSVRKSGSTTRHTVYGSN